MACESLQRVDRLRVVLSVEAVQGSEDAECRWHRQTERFEFYSDFSREHSSRRSSIDNNVVGFVSLQQLPIDRNGIFYSSWKWMLWSQAIQHCDDFDSRVAGDRNALTKRPRVGVKASSMQVDKNLVAVIP